MKQFKADPHVWDWSIPPALQHQLLEAVAADLAAVVHRREAGVWKLLAALFPPRRSAGA